MTQSLLQHGWREAMHRVNGVDMHVVEAGQLGNPLVVLLHGFPAFWWTWRKQIAPLVAAGYHVVVPDMRGYNKSAAPSDVAAYSLDTLAADVVALANTFGADRFHLVGHDWGAIVGWWVAACHPGRLNRVMLMSGPHPDVWANQAPASPVQALRTSYVDFFQLPWLPEASLGAFDFAGLKTLVTVNANDDSLEPGELDHYAEAWAQPGSLTGMINYYRAFGQRPKPVEPARVAPPTLFLWASDDDVLTRDLAEASVALCDHGVMKTVEGADHWLHVAHAERITAEMIGWLAGG